ncbi:MAG: DinB family protein [Pyrinomonadaceae bacterium]
MLQSILSDLYERDLNKLRQEIEQYADEADLWKKSGQIPNSAGNLCQHLCGNLRHFVGAVLGESGYVRDRDSEFTRDDMSRATLIGEIDATMADVKGTLEGLSDDVLASDYPIDVFGKGAFKTDWFLVHLATHLNYHLGQIDYHRRLLGTQQ